jgi:hypothetical protein
MARGKRDMWWAMETHKGETIEEVSPEGEEIYFEEALPGDRLGKELKTLKLFDSKTSRTCSVNMVTGEFFMGSEWFAPAGQIDGRIFKVNGLPDARYAANAVQFKLSDPITVGQNGEVGISAMSVGYRIPLPQWLCRYNSGSEIVTLTDCLALMTVDAIPRTPSFSATFMARYESPDGTVRVGRW